MKFSDLHNPKAAAELIKDFQKRFKVGVCLSPTKDCDGSHIVSAHTLSVSAMLRPISRDGFVYAMKIDLFHPENGHPATLALRGIGETSVFNGFCSKHDKLLFAPIEDQGFACTKEQLFLHAFRAVAKESYLKRKQAEAFVVPDKIKEIHGLDHDLELSEDALLLRAASLKGAEEIERLKSRLDNLFLSKDYGRLVTTVVPFSVRPPVVTSFVYVPDSDFEGSSLQEFDDFSSDLSHLMVTIIPTASGGFLLLSHEDTANAAPRRLIASLLRQTDMTSSIVWLVVCQTENLALAPEWFESLEKTDRENLCAAFIDPSNQLKRRNITVSGWSVGTPFTI